MTPTVAPETKAFLDAVRAELADLPEDDVAELLEDVEQHLAEAAADGRLAELGTPAAYAAELRAAAGLPARQRTALSWAPVRRARAWHARLAGTRAYGEVRAFLPELRPGWWVVRGYLAAVAVAFWSNHSAYQVLPIPHLSGSALLGLALTAALVTASVAWGRRHLTYRRGQRGATVAANVVAVLVALAVTDSVTDRSYGYEVYHPVSYPDEGLRGPYGPLYDLRPYDAEGRPLDGVLLFDETGNAVAPMLCDTQCPRLSFPLHDGPRAPIDPASPYRLKPSPPPSPSPTVSPPPKPTPTASPSAKRRK